MHATSLLNAVLKKYRGTVHTTRFIRDRELGRRADSGQLSLQLEPKDLVEILDGDTVRNLKLETLTSYIDKIDESFDHLDATVRKMCIERIVVPTLSNGTTMRNTLEHKELHGTALRVLGKAVQENPKMVTPHVGVLVAMLKNKYKNSDPDKPDQDEPDQDELDSVKFILLNIFHVEPNEFKKYVKEFLEAMTIEDVYQEWRGEVLDLLFRIRDVDWDLYVNEICNMLETEGNDEPEYMQLLYKLSPQIRPEVRYDDDHKLQLVRVE